ncbi:MAG: HAD family hydrolase [Lachnospiraceae bacterium]|nr:HAD family hydrolase [Lachnospiraceae bacterium]
MIKAALFDMDGTILNTLDDLTISVNYALRTCGLPERTANEVRIFTGNGKNVLIHKSLPEGTSSEKEAEVLRVYEEYYNAHSSDHTAPYPGIKELLEKLKAEGIRLAVVSNKQEVDVIALADKFYGGLFDVVVGSRPGVPNKPAPDLPEIAMKELGVTPSEMVYVGDSDVDYKTAVNSKLPMITVLWGFRDRDMLEALGADTFAETAEDVYNIIMQH